MRLQQGMDERQMFMCEVTTGDAEYEDVETAMEQANNCHKEEVPETDIAWDDVNNCELDPQKVREARAAEMEYFKRMKVYSKVPVQKCKDLTGKMPIKVRWRDTNKQDEANPKYRSRLVAKDFKKYEDPELYAATPPIEMLRFLVSAAATGWSRHGNRRKIMVNDVARAYFHAPNMQPVFVEICEEDREPGDEGMCGELLVSTNGTRPAASNWQKCYTALLCSRGFRRTRANTCMFRHSERDLDVMVHGDDFMSTGDHEDLIWLQKVLEEKFEISTNIVGHGAQKQNSSRSLTASSRWRRMGSPTSRTRGTPRSSSVTWV
jgi:hypothetical protein